MWWIARLLEHPNGPVLLASWVVWVVGSIVLHELAHGWTAIRCGDDTPIVTGHMTWNPVVHMGVPSLIMFAIVGIAWGLMPVNPSRFRGRYDDALVSIAGPAMNLVLAVAALLLYIVWIGLAGGYWIGRGVQEPLFGNVQIFLRTGLMLNLVLIMLNLLPIPPLDGSRVLANFVPSYRRIIEGEQATAMSLIGLIIILVFGGRYLFAVAGDAASVAIDTLGSVLVPGAF